MLINVRLLRALTIYGNTICCYLMLPSDASLLLLMSSFTERVLC